VYFLICRQRSAVFTGVRRPRSSFEYLAFYSVLRLILPFFCCWGFCTLTVICLRIKQLAAGVEKRFMQMPRLKGKPNRNSSYLKTSEPLS